MQMLRLFLCCVFPCSLILASDDSFGKRFIIPLDSVECDGSTIIALELTVKDGLQCTKCSIIKQNGITDKVTVGATKLAHNLCPSSYTEVSCDNDVMAVVRSNSNRSYAQVIPARHLEASYIIPKLNSAWKITIALGLDGKQTEETAVELENIENGVSSQKSFGTDRYKIIRSDDLDLAGLKLSANNKMSVIMMVRKGDVLSVINLPARNRLGRRYILPGNNSYTITGSDTNTSCTFKAKEVSTPTILTTGETGEAIKCTDPVLVTTASSGGSVELMPSISMFGKRFHYSSHTRGDNSKDSGDLRLVIHKKFLNEELEIEDTEKRSIDLLKGKQIIGSDYVEVRDRVSTESVTVTHRNPTAVFYAQLVDQAGGMLAQSSLQLGLAAPFCQQSALAANDNIDNDCDGKTDEELINKLDDDGDGRIDEDTATNKYYMPVQEQDSIWKLSLSIKVLIIVLLVILLVVLIAVVHWKCASWNPPIYDPEQDAIINRSASTTLNPAPVPQYRLSGSWNGFTISLRS